MENRARLDKLLELLKNQYRIDCPQMRETEALFSDRTIRNDHIAFRSVGYGAGIGFAVMQRLWEHFGYEKAKSYDLGNKYAIHMEPPEPHLPKIFLSEFNLTTLKPEDKDIVSEIFSNNWRNILETRCEHYSMAEFQHLPPEELFNFININRYPVPISSKNLNRLNAIDQYLAWVRLFDRKVNHFTLSCNALELPIRKVYYKMKTKMEMSEKIEGENTELAQSSTTASRVLVPVLDKIDNDEPTIGYVVWKYAYYEICERGLAPFEGFKAAQTPGLFAMTGDQNG